MATAVKVTPDWERDGFLVIQDAETIDHYTELRHQQTQTSFSDYDMFCAFSKDQFDEGMKSIRPLQDDEKIYHLGGGVYGTKDGIDKYLAAQHALDERIKQECDPQEVYYYEYNNYECCINWEGDLDPIKVVGSIWGWDVAAKIQRRNAYYSLDEIKSGKPLA